MKFIDISTFGFLFASVRKKKRMKNTARRREDARPWRNIYQRIRCARCDILYVDVPYITRTLNVFSKSLDRRLLYMSNSEKNYRAKDRAALKAFRRRAFGCPSSGSCVIYKANMNDNSSCWIDKRILLTALANVNIYTC